MFTFRNVRILFAAALLAAIFCLAGCSTAAQAVPQPAETSRSAEATPETAIPAPTSTPAPTATPEPTPAAIVPTSVTLDQEGGILNRGMTWTLRGPPSCRRTPRTRPSAGPLPTRASPPSTTRAVINGAPPRPDHHHGRPPRPVASPPPTSLLDAGGAPSAADCWRHSTRSACPSQGRR